MNDSEKDKHSIIVPEDTQVDYLKSEVNLLKFPIFPLDKKLVGTTDPISYKSTRRDSDGSLVEISYSISPMKIPELGILYGHGGPKDFIYFRTLEKILTEKQQNGESLDGEIYIGSFYYFAKRAGQKNKNKRVYEGIYNFFKRLTTTDLFFRNCFYDAVNKKYYEEEKKFTILDRCVFTGEELSDGTIADGIYIVLNENYKNNIKNSYVKYIDYKFYQKIKKPTSKRLYEILSLLSHNKEEIYQDYKSLCFRMGLRQCEYLSHAKQQIKLAVEELINLNFIKSYRWIIRNNDWLIVFKINPNCNGQFSFTNQEEPLLLEDSPLFNGRFSEKTIISPLADLWNRICTDLPKVRGYSEERKKLEEQRLQEIPLERWELIFRKINESDFCKGNNQRKWVATFDWVIKNSENPLKVLEGHYDNPKKDIDYLVLKIKNTTSTYVGLTMTTGDFKKVIITLTSKEERILNYLIDTGQFIIGEDKIMFIVRREKYDAFLETFASLKKAKYEEIYPLISPQKYAESIFNAHLLLGFRYKEDAAVELYKRILNGPYTEEDLGIAIEMLIKNHERINYPGLSQLLNEVVKERVNLTKINYQRMQSEAYQGNAERL